MRKAIVLWSGGIDSTTCLFRLLQEGTHEVYGLMFNYGQLGHAAELTCIRNLVRCIRHDFFSMSSRFRGFIQKTVNLEEHFLCGGSAEKYNGYSSALVPMRNAIFCTIAYYAARKIGADLISIGINASAEMQNREPFPDCTHEFVESMQALFDLENMSCKEEPKVVLEAPLVHMHKPVIAEYAKSIGVPEVETWACYFPKNIDGKEVPCGTCEPCRIRKEAGLSLGGNHLSNGYDEVCSSD